MHHALRVCAPRGGLAGSTLLPEMDRHVEKKKILLGRVFQEPDFLVFGTMREVKTEKKVTLLKRITLEKMQWLNGSFHGTRRFDHNY